MTAVPSSSVLSLTSVRGRPTGTHVAFAAANPSQVDAFFDAALRAGARSHTIPGYRGQGLDEYSGTVVDIDNNALEASYCDPSVALHASGNAQAPSQDTTAPRSSVTGLLNGGPLRSIVNGIIATTNPPQGETSANEAASAKQQSSRSGSDALMGTLLGAAAGAAVAYALAKSSGDKKTEDPPAESEIKRQPSVIEETTVVAVRRHGKHRSPDVLTTVSRADREAVAPEKNTRPSSRHSTSAPLEPARPSSKSVASQRSRKPSSSRRSKDLTSAKPRPKPLALDAPPAHALTFAFPGDRNLPPSEISVHSASSSRPGREVARAMSVREPSPSEAGSGLTQPSDRTVTHSRAVEDQWHQHQLVLRPSHGSEDMSRCAPSYTLRPVSPGASGQSHHSRRVSSVHSRAVPRSSAGESGHTGHKSRYTRASSASRSRRSSLKVGSAASAIKLPHETALPPSESGYTDRNSQHPGASSVTRSHRSRRTSGGGATESTLPHRMPLPPSDSGYTEHTSPHTHVSSTSKSYRSRRASDSMEARSTTPLGIPLPPSVVTSFFSRAAKTSFASRPRSPPRSAAWAETARPLTRRKLKGPRRAATENGMSDVETVVPEDSISQVGSDDNGRRRRSKGSRSGGSRTPGSNGWDRGSSARMTSIRVEG